MKKINITFSILGSERNYNSDFNHEQEIPNGYFRVNKGLIKDNDKILYFDYCESFKWSRLINPGFRPTSVYDLGKDIKEYYLVIRLIPTPPSGYELVTDPNYLVTDGDLYYAVIDSVIGNTYCYEKIENHLYFKPDSELLDRYPGATLILTPTKKMKNTITIKVKKEVEKEIEIPRGYKQAKPEEVVTKFFKFYDSTADNLDVWKNVFVFIGMLAKFSFSTGRIMISPIQPEIPDGYVQLSKFLTEKVQKGDKIWDIGNQAWLEFDRFFFCVDDYFCVIRPIPVKTEKHVTEIIEDGHLKNSVNPTRSSIIDLLKSWIKECQDLKEKMDKSKDYTAAASKQNKKNAITQKINELKKVANITVQELGLPEDKTEFKI